MYHKANLNRIMADYCQQPLSKIEEDTDRDRYMSPLEAKEYGLIDHIIGGEEAVFNVKGSLKKFPKVCGWGRSCASCVRRGEGPGCMMWASVRVGCNGKGGQALYASLRSAPSVPVLQSLFLYPPSFFPDSATPFSYLPRSDQGGVCDGQGRHGQAQHHGRRPVPVGDALVALQEPADGALHAQPGAR
mgnify:CR=1 FL=1